LARTWLYNVPGVLLFTVMLTEVPVKTDWLRFSLLVNAGSVATSSV